MSPTKPWILAILLTIVAVPAFAEDATESPAPAEPMAEVPAEAETPASDAPAAADAAEEWPEAAAEPALDEDDPAPAALAPDAEAESASDPETAEAWTGGAADATAEPVDPTHPPLGAIGYDSEGRRGRIHIVVGGDTLWDISDAYLGTSWVWPSIWNDNGDIENPHLIYPGDRIWITPSEMRKITAEEAAQMLANTPPAPAAPEEFDLEEELEPEPEPAPLVTEPIERGSVRVAGLEHIGLITPEQLEASASIVGRVPERVLLSQEDDVYIGHGESEVDAGDELTMFRTHEKVFDPDTGRLLGYHVEFLGWVQVEETFPESARASIRMSTGDVEEGDRLMPREEIAADVPLQASPMDIEGKISFFPKKRVLMGLQDFVYLNRGTLDGLEVGSPLEVYRPGYAAAETARQESVHIPDRVIASLVVVRVEGQAAVALVTRSEGELALGDRFRGREETP